MKVLFNGWFSGFIDKTNPGLNYDFFINLFNKVYEEKCEIGTIENSEILCEFDMLIGSKSQVKCKKWKTTYLFSGESTLKCNKANYNCVLWGERNHKNVVNMPLFIPYLYTNNFVNCLLDKNKRTTVPEKDVCVIISNPGGGTRNKFLQNLDRLSKYLTVDYAGRYKNNIGGSIKYDYNTPEFLDFVSQYKFIISMENSREDTYITEKLMHGLITNIIPVYWGSLNVGDYINKHRFINLEGDDNKTINKALSLMLNLKKYPHMWLDVVNKPNSPDNKLARSIDDIVMDIKCVLNKNCWNTVSQICCVSNPKFEPERCKILKELFDNQEIDRCFIKYISPTYKHTITNEEYDAHITQQLVTKLRPNKMKKTELSLFLNYKANLEYIAKNYKEGAFLIFESDVMIGKNISMFDEFLTDIKDKKWDLIHIGMYDNRIWENPNFNNNTGYTDRTFYNNNNAIEDITTQNENFRLSRKFYTRCSDSFIWKYEAVIKFLNYMNTEKNYGIPFDYYMCNYFEKNPNTVKHYWSEDEFFKQGSNLGLVQTTIQ
jgi:hypothetical protein